MPKSKKTRRQNPRQARRDNIEWWLTFLMTVALSSIIGCESMVML